MITVSPTQIHSLPPDLYPDRIGEEVQQFLPTHWQRFDQGLPLIALGGQFTYDLPLSGYLKPTHLLDRCPILQQWLSQSQVILGRVRLVQLLPDQTLKITAAQTYHQSVYRSLWIPLVNADQCTLHVDHCRADSSQAFKNDRLTIDRQHLYLFNPEESYTFHYCGGDRFLALWIETPIDLDLPAWILDPKIFAFNPEARLSIIPYCFRVINPLEMVDLLSTLKADLLAHAPDVDYQNLKQHINTFSQSWEKTFHQFGYSLKGELFYQDLILHFKEKIVTKAMIHLPATGLGYRSIKIISSTLVPTEQTNLRQFSRRVMEKRKQDSRQEGHILNSADLPVFEKPIFIVSAPRAGSTLLFETLSRFQEFWSIGKESHDLMEGMPELHPAQHDYHSNRLNATIVTPTVIETLQKRFVAQLRNHENVFYLNLNTADRPNPLRLLEKTPKNALRIPFLKAVFPEAHFIYLYRKPAPNINSMLEGWRLRRFVSYRDLPHWPHTEWNFLLIPEWQNLKSASLAEIVAHQWTAANTYIFQDLQALPREQWHFIDYDDLVKSPQETIRNITKFAGLMPDEVIERSLAKGLPTSCMTLSVSSPDKWRKYEDEITPVLPITQTICSLVEELKWSQL